MSMIGNLARVPEHVRSSLHEDPSKIDALLYPDDADKKPVKKLGFFSRLFGLKQKPRPISSCAIEPLSAEDSVDIDKTWHALHFLFTGTNWKGDFPEGFLVSCGKPVGDVDVGYGPARSFTSTEVKRISEFLMHVDRDVLRSRLDPEKIERLEIYWSGDNTHLEEDWAYLEGRLSDLTAFVAETAQKDLALLVYIS
ncbi:MAG: hypothetical protein B7Z37_24175 [Verrucomicrobia bacterium 12-59-8]|nr:MAG: hypothetical protein B7Z37_24175 [Verrucomicrobia bacterium 12-59-8]